MMKAMILAAGFGRRLYPLTLTKPKPLICVGGKPLIVYHIEQLAKQGITDIIINISWLGEQIIQTLGQGKQWGVKLTYSKEEHILETGGGIYKALPFLTDIDIHAPFIVINGDIYTDYLIKNSLTCPHDKLAHLILIDNPDFHPKGDFSLEKDVVGYQAHNRFTFSGMSVLSPLLFESCSAGRYTLASVLREAIINNLVTGEYYTGFWNDGGTIERINAIHNYITDLS